MTAILPAIYKLSILFTICKRRRRLIARRLEGLVQDEGNIEKGDDVHGEERIVRAKVRLPNNDA